MTVRYSLPRQPPTTLSQLFHAGFLSPDAKFRDDIDPFRCLPPGAAAGE